MNNKERDKIEVIEVLGKVLGAVGLVLVIIIGGILISEVKAENVSPRLAVAPHTFELEVKRGQILEDRIKVLNQSEVAIPMKTKITDFTAEEETGKMLFDESAQDSSFASRFWIKIENPEFILDPWETETVKFSIEVPENAEPGGKYAVVLFEPQLPSFYFKEGQPRAIPVIGVLFLFSVEVEGLTRPEEPLTIVEFNIPENLHLRKLENLVAGVFGIFSEVWAAKEEVFSIVETSHLPFTLRIKNNDIYHQKLGGKLLILASNGKIVGETEIQKTTILPGKIRKFPVEFEPNLSEKLEKYLPAKISDFISKNLLLGKYRAHLLLTTDYGIIEKDLEFWAFPWKFGLSTVFILCIFFLFLIKYRKRIKLAIRVLVRR